MSGTFFHGVTNNQVPTSLLTPRQAPSALPVIFGCAPIHRLAAEDRAKVLPGKIGLLYDSSEAGTRYGIDVQNDDFDAWQLSEAAYAYFALFNVAPVVFANLFDPAVHRKTVASEAVAITDGTGTLANGEIIEATLTDATATTTYVEGTDYVLNRLNGQVTAVEDGAMAAVTSVTASYAYAAPEMVTSADCIGGYNIATGVTTGISLVDSVYPRFLVPPAIGLAPKFGEDPTVAAVLDAKMKSVNGGVFRGIAITDIPSDGTAGVKLYTDIPAYKQGNNLVSEDLFLTWPKVKFGDRTMRMSVQTAALMATVDADHGGIPYASPSNKNLQMTACVVDGEELWLDVQKANYLNANGVATALNFEGGWKLWGNWTACYPSVSDPKDYFITARRMMAWYGNRLTMTWWAKLDWPMTRRLVQTIVNTEQVSLNALTAGEALHGGRIALLESENSITDLMSGKIVFHVWLGLTPPAKEIEFKLEYDPTYAQTLFTMMAA